MSSPMIYVVLGYCFLLLAYVAHKNGRRFAYYWNLWFACLEFGFATVQCLKP